MQRLVYAESKLEKVNITLDLLRTLPPLLMAHLTESLFESVPLNDTPALLATINSAPQSPSIQTVSIELEIEPLDLICKCFFVCVVYRYGLFKNV